MSFDESTVDAIWAKAQPIPDYDSNEWRRDDDGKVIRRHPPPKITGNGNQSTVGKSTMFNRLPAAGVTPRATSSRFIGKRMRGSGASSSSQEEGGRTVLPLRPSAGRTPSGGVGGEWNGDSYDCDRSGDGFHRPECRRHGLADLEASVRKPETAEAGDRTKGRRIPVHRSYEALRDLPRPSKYRSRSCAKYQILH